MSLGTIWEWLGREYPQTKVPRVTIFFWIIKICCTTVGETMSDAVNSGANLGLGITAAIFFPFLMVFLVGQMSVSRYMHPVYWGAVMLTSICGTIATDGLHDNLNVDLWVEILVFGVLMMATFTVWLVVEKTLAIHSIYTLRRELFYWMTIFWTFAMGTAVGDQIQASFVVPFAGNDPNCADDGDCTDTSITPWSSGYYLSIAPTPAPAPAPSPVLSPSPAPAPAPSSEYIPCCFYQYDITMPQLMGMWFGVMGALLLLWLALRLAGFFLPSRDAKKAGPSLHNWRLHQWLPEGFCPVGSIQEIVIFWIAYILTRPMGATMGDFLSADNTAVASPSNAYPSNLMTSPDTPPGLALGYELTSVILFGVMLVCLFFCMETKYDVIKEDTRGYLPGLDTPSDLQSIGVHES